VTFFLSREQQREVDCWRCGGDGTKKERLRPVRGKLKKQRTETLAQLEVKVRELLPDRQHAFSLGFNDFERVDGSHK